MAPFPFPGSSNRTCVFTASGSPTGFFAGPRALRRAGDQDHLAFEINFQPPSLELSTQLSYAPQACASNLRSATVDWQNSLRGNAIQAAAQSIGLAAWLRNLPLASPSLAAASKVQFEAGSGDADRAVGPARAPTTLGATDFSAVGREPRRGERRAEVGEPVAL